MINWIYFPVCDRPSKLAQEVVAVFESAAVDLDSSTHLEQESNIVLSKVRDGLIGLGFQVEAGKKANQKINVPVLFGQK